MEGDDFKYPAEFPSDEYDSRGGAAYGAVGGPGYAGAMGVEPRYPQAGYDVKYAPPGGQYGMDTSIGSGGKTDTFV